MSEKVVCKRKFRTVLCSDCGVRLGLLEYPEAKGIYYCPKCRKDFLIVLKSRKLSYEVFVPEE